MCCVSIAGLAKHLPNGGVTGEGKLTNAIIEKSFSNEVIQAKKTVTGKIVDANGEPLPGVTILEQGTMNGTISNFDGEYTLQVADENAMLVFSFIGMEEQVLPVKGASTINVLLKDESMTLDDVVVVGYGIQKKQSVVGAITQAKGETLLKSGGVATVGEALQGKLPGVTSIFSNSVPGENEPQIFIRGQSSWNGGTQPLILVDGMERSMSDIDLNEIESMSVLKDASATAVFGVKGGNGVILITTKRGQEGKAKLSVSGNMTFKSVSKLPQSVDSYDGIMIANESITHEMLHEPGSWNNYVPMEIANRYRNYSDPLDKYIYPNVDWQDMMLKDYAKDYRANLSVSGGSKKAQYFANFTYQHVSDIFDTDAFSNGRGYESAHTYDRFNYRSNLDFKITNTTKFSVNLSGFYGLQKKPGGGLTEILFGLYSLAPDIYYPQYDDGSYGIYHSPEYWSTNPVKELTSRGFVENNKFQINSDFVLDQKLGFITQGLSFNGRLSYDNNFTAQKNVNDEGNYGTYGNTINKYYDENGQEIFLLSEGVNEFDFVQAPWSQEALDILNGSRSTRFNYQLSLNYNRTFSDKHATTALFLFKREEFVLGSRIPNRQEDWVSRVTYNYDSRYFVDVNGAYNGSNKFGPGYRFDFFPSTALGWMISNESFMSDFDWLDKLKIRASYGKVGDDQIGRSVFDYRWSHLYRYGSGGYAYLNSANFGATQPIYSFYYEDQVGNADVHWETSTKSNVGFELSLLKNMFTVDFDYFTENRDDIFVKGEDRSVSDIFGAEAPPANTGETEVKGFELVLGVNHQFVNGIGVRGNFSLTQAKDKVISREDPELTPDYQKQAGYPIGTYTTPIPGELLTSLDELYTSVPLEGGQNFRRPGYYNYLDYNGDGYYSRQYDNVPYGYTNRPERIWTASLGTSYKGWNFSVDFYGTQNATRYYDTRNLVKQQHLYFEHTLDYWSLDNPNGTEVLQPYSLTQANTDNREDFYDASLVRLKTVELSYTVPKKLIENIGIDNLRLFVNGNNLYLWTDMPDDREFNGGNIGQSSYRGNYPNLKRINVGFNLNF